MQLRDYQLDAVAKIEAAWQESNTTLCVVPTGGGKTVIFCELIRRKQPLRAMVLAHRTELVGQAVKRLAAFGIEAEIEQADLMATTTFWNRTPVVVATVQTLGSGPEEKRRLARFNPNDFDLLICDEAHHYTSPQFRSPINHFLQNPRLKVCGFTATPDRADEEALGQVFQSCAVDLECMDLIHDGWLVPVDQQFVQVEGLDFSQMRTTAGDLNGADLAAVMEAEQNLHGVASPTIEIIGDRRALVFTVTVRHAEMLADIFNRHKPGMADWVCGKTPKDQRKETFKKFSDGTTQVLVNVGVLTEGVDIPAIEVVVQARPTKSRCLYSQMVGRALRPLPGLVDGIPTAEERRAAIAASPKPSALVIDFAGNSGRHKLVSAADILGGKVSDEAVEAAVQRAKQDGRPVRVDEALDEEEERIKKEMEERRAREAARKLRLKATASFSVTSVNPFDLLEVTPDHRRGWDRQDPPTEAQRARLLKWGIDPNGMTKRDAGRMIGAMIDRLQHSKCTLKQMRVLVRAECPGDIKNLTIAEATQRIDQLARNRWQRPAEWGPKAPQPEPVTAGEPTW